MKEKVFIGLLLIVEVVVFYVVKKLISFIGRIALCSAVIHKLNIPDFPVIIFVIFQLWRAF